MDPPVPIPNTVVKHSYVESTWLETTWEDRKLLVDDAPARVRFFMVICHLYGTKRVVSPGRKKKHIPKSDSIRDFSEALIFYGHFHDIMKYSGVPFHVFFS